jgi:hypothetical protein
MAATHIRAEPAIITKSGIAVDFAIAIPPDRQADGILLANVS